MKKKKSVWFMMAAILIGFIPPILIACSSIAHAIEIQPDKIVDQAGLKVSSSVSSDGNSLNWELQYEKNVASDGNDQALKFKVTADGEAIAFNEDASFATNDDQWFAEKDFSKQSQGSLSFTTVLNVSKVALEIQADATKTDETQAVTINKNILTSAVEGPHELKLPAVATEETTEVSAASPPTAEEIISSQATETTTQTEEASEATEGTIQTSDDSTMVGPQQNYYRSSAASTYDVSAYNDPFKYTPDGGQYPSHDTNQYTKSDSSDMIKNYNYGSAGDSDSNVEIQNILEGNLNFDNGYHAYDVGNNQNINLKKIVIPTDNPTQFQIQLDIIGGSLKTRKNVDVAFVVDKSGSMDGNRWTNLKLALGTFAHGLLDDNPGGSVQFGIAGFGSVIESRTHVPYGKVGNFGVTQGNYTGFTTSADAFLTHALLNERPSGGTPTFLGLDAGLELLTNSQYNGREDAQKVLIILTDGLPTWGPTTTYTSSNDGIRQSGMTSSFNNNGRVETFKATNTTLYIGNGSDISSTVRSNTISHGQKRTEQNLEIDRYAIGFEVDDVNDILDALGPQGKYSATSQTDLNHVLNQIKKKIQDVNALIRNANVFDPMSKYVALDTSSVKTQALTLKTSSPKSLNVTTGTQPDYVNDVTVDTRNNSVNLSNLTLSGNDTQRDGLRVTYTVSLKEEYQDDKFYPANGPTYLADNQYKDQFGFAVPSVKVPPQKFDIEAEKIWDDEDNQWGTRKEVTLQLQQKSGNENWANVSGKTITIKANATGDSLKGKFSDVPAYDSSKNVLEYRVVEERVNGYEEASYSPTSINVNSDKKLLQVTNKLLKTSVTFTKVGNDGKTPLAGAGFTLYKADGTTAIGKEVTSDDNGQVTFDIELPIGKYVIKETTTPLGYETQDPIEIMIADADGKLTVSDIKDNQVVNLLKDFELIVTKKDNLGKDLKGAKFKLVGKDYSKELDSDTNVFKFTGLKPGEYELIETVTPDGYVGLKDSIKIVIDQDGKVTIDGKEQKDVITTDGNVIKYNVANQQKGLLPSTGGQGIRHLMEFALLVIGLSALVGGIYVYRNRKELN
ncbi:SpaA isopeptide-forming pilin-related protein [Lactococcus raffinolactis]|uniref:vWA domain-containing protein n=1 Tax=Pseudolactococcus raffinolactis TaxID=1366 RepID=UPI00288E748A|nr:SpaA isopeptide-forming pilin-related protein [Lactococcus raffinolactis]MDT2766700.1 SpaA isopeptide-forming pilin-related protein [Lactococcus raffinolactis]MDT2789914.1 SpaA isopeptide-forming pilin-related protein [Lactococcus raffinolactis]